MELSIAIPCSHEFAPLLDVTLKSIRSQFSGEICIGIDGEDSADTLHPIAQRHSAASIVSKRECDLPHKNKARNAAVNYTSGDFVWVLDADAAPDKGTIESLRNAIQSHTSVAVPCIFQKKRDGTTTHYNYSSYSRMYDHNGRTIMLSAPPKENFPLFSRHAYEALSGFFEDYVGWGGNKEDFVRRLGKLQGMNFFVVTNARLILQWHPPTDRTKQNMHHNRRLFRKRMHDIASGAAWWSRQLANWNQALERMR